MSKQKRLMVAISGASGAVYAKRLLEVLPQAYETIYLCATDMGKAVLEKELGVSYPGAVLPAGKESAFRVIDHTDLFAPPASGSHDYDGMVAIPCSMGLAGRIAAGVSDDLITRAADVCLKERRKLVMVVRETPFNLIHLRNLTTLAEAGAIVLPAAPGFYNDPQSIGDLVDYVVDRVLRALELDIRLAPEWGEQS